MFGSFLAAYTDAAQINVDARPWGDSHVIDGSHQTP